MNAPDKNAVLNHLTGLLEQINVRRPADIFADLADRFCIGNLGQSHVSAADELKDKIRALPGMEMDIEELEYRLGKYTLFQVSGSAVKVPYEYEAGQDEYVTGLPENCYPGIDETLDIDAPITCETFVFECKETGITLTIPPLTNIGWMLTEKQADTLHDQVLDKLNDEFEEAMLDAKRSRYEASHDY